MFWKSAALAIVASLIASCSEARVSGVPQTDEPAVTTCNINTGVATGLDAGTCASPAANCNGVADNSAAFKSFNTWARRTTTNTNGQLIELVVTGKCNFKSGNAKTFAGLKKARLMGYGATFTSNGHLPGFGPAGASTPAGICHKGLDDATGCSARINSVLAGATSVTITNTAFCSRFVAGRWAVVTGFDLQGGYKSPYGYPPNPHFFDYVQIGSTDNCATTGQILLGSALTNSYRSTWPNFNTGNVFEADQGGPATIYALDSSWDGEVDIRGATIDDVNNQSIYQGRSVIIRDVTMTGAHCIIPSQNESFTMINSMGASCNIEVDKIINNLTYQGTTLRRVSFQSSSTNTLTWDGGSLVLDMNGTPKVANISNLTIPTIRLGPYAYGTPISATCTNCVITNPIASFGVMEKGGGGDPGANVFYTVSGGVFSYPLGVNITNLTDNGSGKVRLTVADTTGWATNAVAGKSGIFATCSAPSPCTGGAKLTIVNGTQIDLLDFNFADVKWSGAGFLYNSAEQERWAIPGTNVFPVGQWGASTPAFQVTGVTRSGNFVNIATTLSGGFPTIPLSRGKGFLQVQAPKWTCTNCSGNAQAVDFSGAPANTPIFSYSNRTFNNSTALSSWNLWGKVTSIKINVMQAYTGSTNPLRVNLPEETIVPAGTTTFWNPLINLRQAGLRTITPAGVTCDTGGGPVAGACSGDSGLTLPSPTAMFAGTIEQQMPNGTPTDQPWTMTAEFIMDQGVVP